jgi:type IX secretion system PorP/SprF family membrane protein
VNMKYKIVIAICVYLLPTISKAQDPLFSQFYHSPLYLNPGLAGCGKNDFRLSYSSRVQWMRLPNPMQYHSFAADKYFDAPNVSAGAIINHFEEGYVKTTYAGAILAKNFGNNGYNCKDWFFNFAMQFGFAVRNVNKDKLLFGDQLNQNGPNGQQSQVELFQNANRAYFDASAGAVLTYSNWMFGFAAQHLTQPYNGLVGDGYENKLQRRYTFHASFLKDAYSEEEGGIIYKPTAILNYQSSSRSLMLGSLFDMPERNIEFGLWYRNNWSFSNNHSVVISMNIKFGKQKNYYTGQGDNRYRAGVSYDAELTRPGVRTTAGSAEMGLLYEAFNETCPKPSGGCGGRFPWEFH